MDVNFVIAMVRRSGVPADLFIDEDLNRRIGLVDAFQTCAREMVKQREALSNCLYESIGSEADYGKRKQLLRIKRNIEALPLRKPDESVILTNAALIKWRELLLVLGRYERLLDELINDEEAQLQHFNGKVRRALNNDMFTRALALSSRNFFSRIADRGECEDGYFASLASQDAATFIRYLTRSCFKPSPFSTYTELIAARGIFDRQDLELAAFSLRNSGVDRISHVEANNLIIAPFVEWTKKSILRLRNVQVRANSSIVETSQQVIAIQTILHKDDIIRMGNSEALKAILRLARESDFTLENFLTRVGSLFNIPLATAEEIVAHLIDNDLLTTCTVDRLLREFTRSVNSGVLELLCPEDDEYCQNVVQFSSELSQACALLPQQSGRERLSLMTTLEKSYGRFLTSSERVAPPALRGNPAQPRIARWKPLPVEVLLYEDVAIAPRQPLKVLGGAEASRDIKRLYETIYSFAERASFLEPPLCLFADSLLKPSGYLPLVFVAAAHASAVSHDPHTDASLKSSHRALWEEAQSRHLQNFQEYSKQIRSFVEKTAVKKDVGIVVDLNQWTEPCSFSRGYRFPPYLGFTVQQTGRTEIAALVLNEIFPGTGVLFSRFTKYYDQAFQESLLRKYENSERIHAEIRWGSLLNVSNFPSLCRFQIVGPARQANKSGGTEICLDDLFLAKRNGVLMLFSKQFGKQVVPIRTSLQRSPGLDSSACSLLESMGHWSSGLGAVVDEAHAKFPDSTRDDNFADYPRVLLSGSLILQRRRIIINTKWLISRLRMNESKVFLTALYQWIAEANIPSCVFIKWNRRDENLIAANKPQLIIFADLACCYLFKRIVLNTSAMITLEEAIPFGGADKPRVEEYAIEI